MSIVEVKVPQLSESVSEGTLLTWKKKPGEAIAIDEILVEVETDKVVLEVPAPAAGVPRWRRARLIQSSGASRQECRRRSSTPGSDRTRRV